MKNTGIWIDGRTIASLIDNGMYHACLSKNEQIGELSRDVTSLLHVHNAVVLMRALVEKIKAGDKGFSCEQAHTQRLHWFREYFKASGLRIRSNTSIRRIVELHLGPHGLATWDMLHALGYNPADNDFWLELDGCIAAHSPFETLPEIDGAMFLGA